MLHSFSIDMTDNNLDQKPPLMDEWSSDSGDMRSLGRAYVYKRMGYLVERQDTHHSDLVQDDMAPWDCMGGAGSGQGPTTSVKQRTKFHYRVYGVGKKLPVDLPTERYLPAEERPEKCFVATAVYQNPIAEQVELYKWFRGNYLRPNRVGNRFVQWYESGGGQQLADIVERHPTLRVPSMVFLDIGALAIKSLKYVKEKIA